MTGDLNLIYRLPFPASKSDLLLRAHEAGATLRTLRDLAQLSLTDYDDPDEVVWELVVLREKRNTPFVETLT